MNCSHCHEEIKDEHYRVNTKAGLMHERCYGALSTIVTTDTDCRLLRRVQVLEQFMDDIKKATR